ncbi:MAG: hypothetical protein K2X48_15740 [Chitinophagaceae bacterium]|nr:hypothetical protein [Chitinophagaceae bacterium]
MANIFHQDFRNFLEALNKNKVQYLLVGGYAVVFHGHARTTGGMDIWVNCTKENYMQLLKAFREFGMPVFDMTEEKFLSPEKYDVFRFGRKPVAIDIMTKMSDFNFNECFKMVTYFKDEDLAVPVVHINTLIAAKKAAGRQKDLNDIQWLSQPEE